MNMLNFLEIIVDAGGSIIDVIAWPFTLVVLVLVFRKPILDRINAKIKFSYKDFGMELDEIKKKRLGGGEKSLLNINQDNLSWETYLDMAEIATVNTGYLALLLKQGTSDTNLKQMVKVEFRALLNFVNKHREKSTLSPFYSVLKENL